jgi:hypothetical protein
VIVEDRYEASKFAGGGRMKSIRAIKKRMKTHSILLFLDISSAWCRKFFLSLLVRDDDIVFCTTAMVRVVCQFRFPLVLLDDSRGIGYYVYCVEL